MLLQARSCSLVKNIPTLFARSLCRLIVSILLQAVSIRRLEFGVLKQVRMCLPTEVTQMRSIRSHGRLTANGLPPLLYGKIEYTSGKQPDHFLVRFVTVRSACRQGANWFVSHSRFRIRSKLTASGSVFLLLLACILLAPLLLLISGAAAHSICQIEKRIQVGRSF